MKKDKRPIERKFWSYLKFLPTFVRAHYLRSKFEVAAELPQELVLKQAETEDEINAALQLVYESYLELNYIDANQARKRLTKFHLLPTTVILIVKRDEVVIGTISIIMDSPMGIPSDSTWDLSRFRKNGAQIAEISSLCIKKSEFRRGQLLLPLCKIMYIYCKHFLKIDGIIASTKIEVEPFYTDILLFEKVIALTGQNHKFVKDSPSTCCYLALNDDVSEKKYKRIYNGKSDKFNLYKFFVEKNTVNIKLPEIKSCLQSYTYKQTLAMSKIVSRLPQEVISLTDSDRQIISNLDLTKQYATDVNAFSKIRDDRFETRNKVKCFLIKSKKLIDGTLLNVSETGFKINLQNDMALVPNEDSVEIHFYAANQKLSFIGQIKWSKKSFVGCQVINNNSEWVNYIRSFNGEIQSLAA